MAGVRPFVSYGCMRALDPIVLETINLFDSISSIGKGGLTRCTCFKYPGFGLSHISHIYCQLQDCAKGIKYVKLHLATTV